MRVWDGQAIGVDDGRPWDELNAVGHAASLARTLHMIKDIIIYRSEAERGPFSGHRLSDEFPDSVGCKNLSCLPLIKGVHQTAVLQTPLAGTARPSYSRIAGGKDITIMATGRIFSIGYGSNSQSTILEQLRLARVGYVIDVRSSPYSRFQPDFSREPLTASLNSNDMKYVFMGDLLGGRPKDDDCYTDGHVDYTKTRSKDFFIRGIDRLKTAYGKGLNICMLCSEGHPSQCHRSKLIGEVLVDHGIGVTHILPNGSTKSQSEVISELTDGQSDMFGDQFKSRKSYR